MSMPSRYAITIALLAFAACGAPKTVRPAQQPAIYETGPAEGVRDIANLSQEPVAFNRSSLKISRQEIPAEQIVPDENRIRMRVKGDCGAVIAADRLQRLRDRFSGKTALAYNLYPANRASDQPVYHVIAIPNAPGYSTEGAATDDLIDACDAAMFPLVVLNKDWLVFAGSSCLGQTETEACRLYDEEIRPTITVR